MRTKRNPDWRDNGPEDGLPGAEGAEPSVEFNDTPRTPDQNVIAVPEDGTSLDDDDAWWDGFGVSNQVEMPDHFNDMADSIVAMEHYMLNNQGRSYTIDVSGNTHWCSGSAVSSARVGTLVGSGMIISDEVVMALKTVSWAGTSLADPGAGAYNVSYTGTVPTVFGSYPWRSNTFNIAFSLSIAASAGDFGRWANFVPPNGKQTTESQGILPTIQNLPILYGMLTRDTSSETQFKFYIKAKNFASDTSSFSENEYVWPLFPSVTSEEIRNGNSPYTQYAKTRVPVVGDLGPFFIEARNDPSRKAVWPRLTTGALPSQDIFVSSGWNEEGDWCSGFLWDKSSNSLQPTNGGDIEVEFMLHALDDVHHLSKALDVNYGKAFHGFSDSYSTVYGMKTGIFVRRVKTSTYSSQIPRWDCYVLRFGCGPYNVPSSGNWFATEAAASAFIVNHDIAIHSAHIAKVTAETLFDYTDSNAWWRQWQIPYMTGSATVPAASGIAYTTLSASALLTPVYKRAFSVQYDFGDVLQGESPFYYIDLYGQAQNGNLYYDTGNRTRYLFRAKGDTLTLSRKASGEASWTEILSVTDSSISSTSYPGHYGIIQRARDLYPESNSVPGGEYLGLSNIKSRLASNDESLNLGTGTITAQFVFSSTTLSSSLPVFVT